MEPLTWLTIGLALLGGLVAFVAAKASGMSTGKSLLVGAAAATGTAALVQGLAGLSEDDKKKNPQLLQDILNNSSGVVNGVGKGIAEYEKNKQLGDAANKGLDIFKEHPGLLYLGLGVGALFLLQRN